MAKYRYKGDNIRILDPSNSPVSQEYKFGPGGSHTVAEIDEQLFESLLEFERVDEPAPAEQPIEKRPKRGDK